MGTLLDDHEVRMGTLLDDHDVRMGTLLDDHEVSGYNVCLIFCY